MRDSCVTVLADGRDLGWLELGDPAGMPVFAFHGTPGSRLQLAIDDAPIRAAGLRLICPDRPGYGLSTFQPGRRLVDWPADVVSLADHLGIERFAVMGISGGGPHSAVCAALLGDRVDSAAIVSGVGPLADPRAIEGMMRANQIFTALARRRSRVLEVVFRLQVSALRRWPSRALDLMVKQLPPADVAILARPEVRELFKMVLEKTPGRLETRRPEVSPRLAEIVHRALDRDPDRRFADVREFATALRPFAVDT